MSKVVGPETNEPVGFHIFKREEVHYGQYADLAPDISIDLGSRYYPSAFSRDSLWIEYAASGSHVPQGVFMAYGPDIKKGGDKLPNLKIYDITPTVLHILGLPVPDDVDGKVLTEIFDFKSELAKRPVAYEKVSEKKI